MNRRICGQKSNLGMRIIRNIAKAYSPQKIIIFGSFARGDYHEGSDIDLVIIKETNENFLKRIDNVLDCCDGEIAIEPLVYTPSEIRRMIDRGNDFIASVISKGKVAYEKQESA